MLMIAAKNTSTSVEAMLTVNFAALATSALSSSSSWARIVCTALWMRSSTPGFRFSLSQRSLPQAVSDSM